MPSLPYCFELSFTAVASEGRFLHDDAGGAPLPSQLQAAPCSELLADPSALAALSRVGPWLPLLSTQAPLPCNLLSATSVLLKAGN